MIAVEGGASVCVGEGGGSCRACVTQQASWQSARRHGESDLPASRASRRQAGRQRARRALAWQLVGSLAGGVAAPGAVADLAAALDPDRRAGQP